MKRIAQYIESGKRRIAAGALSMLMSSMLPAGAIAATFIEAKYDDTTNGRFVITSNESVAPSRSFGDADKYSKAVVEFGSEEMFHHVEDYDRRTALVVNETHGRAQLQRDNGTPTPSLAVNYWLHAVGGAFKATRRDNTTTLFLQSDRCPAVHQGSPDQNRGHILLETGHDYSLRCEVADSGSSTIFMNDLMGVFQLEFPDPLKMRSGTYSGTIKAAVPTQDATALTDVSIRLIVQHSIKVEFPKTSVELRPASSATGTSGPGTFRGTVDFSVTSVDPFTVYLACSAHMGNRCAIGHNTIANKQFPVDVQAEIAGMRGGASSAFLNTSKQGSPIFETQDGAALAHGRLQLSLAPETTRKMPAGSYSGKVTVIFDAVLD